MEKQETERNEGPEERDVNEKKTEEAMGEILKMLNDNKSKSGAYFILTPFLFPNRFLSMLIFYLINFVVIFALTGLFGIRSFNNITEIALFTLHISVADLFFIVILFAYFRSIIIKSLGAAPTLLSFLTVTIYSSIAYSEHFNNLSHLLFFVFAFIVLRTMLTNMVRRYYFLYRMKRGRK
ncbi:MAG: hypothetical protein FWE36_05355 [Erysipelotrichales bacterium]|nr:hypothetical protein [Erysipelotrichales bacterium]